MQKMNFFYTAVVESISKTKNVPRFVTKTDNGQWTIHSEKYDKSQKVQIIELSPSNTREKIFVF